MKKLLITIFATCSISLFAQITEITGLWEPYEMNYIYHVYTNSDTPTEFQDGWYDNSDADSTYFHPDGIGKFEGYSVVWHTEGDTLFLNDTLYTFEFEEDTLTITAYDMDIFTGLYESNIDSLMYYEALDEAFFEGIEISSITEVDLYTQYSFIFVSELSSANKDNFLPKGFVLNQNYPNPFNPVTILSYTLPENSFVNVHVFDMVGRTIKILVSEMQTAGNKVLRWNATDAAGSPVSAGIYLYAIQAGEFRQTRKMVLLK